MSDQVHDISGMPAEAVARLLKDGRLDDLLAGREDKSPPEGDDQLSRDDLASMSPEEVRQAMVDGKLNDVLGIK